MRDSVTVHMDASADEVWGLLSDVTRIGELSPETFEGEWTGDSTGPELGATFRGHVKRNGRGPTYWTNCKVTACEPGRSFGFDVLGPGDKVVNSWRYDIAEADGGGVDVTESFALAQNLPTKLYWAVAGRWRGKTNRDGMTATLNRAKAVVEA